MSWYMLAAFLKRRLAAWVCVMWVHFQRAGQKLLLVATFISPRISVSITCRTLHCLRAVSVRSRLLCSPHCLSGAHLLLLLCVTVMSARPAATQLAAPPQPASDTVGRGALSWATDSQAVADASHAWMRALQRGDARALDTLLDAGYRLSGPSNGGVGVDKATWIRNSQTLLTTDSASYPIMGYRSVAPDVVVGSGVLYWRTKVRGWPLPIRSFAVTDVWVRRADTGAWKVVARDGEIAPRTAITLGGLAGAALISVVWALTAWWQRRRRRRFGTVPAVGRAQKTANPAPSSAT